MKIRYKNMKILNKFNLDKLITKLNKFQNWNNKYQK